MAVRRQLNSQGSVNAADESICDIIRRSNLAGATAYVPELPWILFLRILDERELRETEEVKASSVPFTPSLAKPYRWQEGQRRAARSAGSWWSRRRASSSSS